jgi:hypothetical protein
LAHSSGGGEHIVHRPGVQRLPSATIRCRVHAHRRRSLCPAPSSVGDHVPGTPSEVSCTSLQDSGTKVSACQNQPCGVGVHRAPPEGLRIFFMTTTIIARLNRLERSASSTVCYWACRRCRIAFPERLPSLRTSRYTRKQAMSELLEVDKNRHSRHEICASDARSPVGIFHASGSRRVSGGSNCWSKTRESCIHDRGMVLYCICPRRSNLLNN